MTKILCNNHGFVFVEKKQPEATTIKSWKNTLLMKHNLCVCVCG